jgi:hypothetical protein
LSPTPARWIRTADDLAALVEALAGCRAIALDTEADSLHHYVEKVCLIQLAADHGGAWLIDPLALPDLTALAPILADGGGDQGAARRRQRHHLAAPHLRLRVSHRVRHRDRGPAPR